MNRMTSKMTCEISAILWLKIKQKRYIYNFITLFLFKVLPYIYAFIMDPFMHLCFFFSVTAQYLLLKLFSFPFPTSKNLHFVHGRLFFLKAISLVILMITIVYKLSQDEHSGSCPNRNRFFSSCK